jgi:glycosyltransferase involved in cell wall biosynthesis
MKLLVYGDIGGSGGYFRYVKGLFSNGVVPNDLIVYFITSESFKHKLGMLDKNVKVIHHEWIDSPSRIKRYLWHLWVYPSIVRKLNPDLEFYANGQLRVYFRKALTVATCHNLLLFDDSEINRINNKNEKKYFLETKNRQTNSFAKSNGLIFLSNHSKDIILPQIEPNKFNRIISHGLDTEFLMNTDRNFSFKDKINILYVSPIFHYKNHLALVKAFQLLKKDTNLNIHLNLVGGGNSSASKELLDYININDLNKFITIKQFIDTKGLNNEYLCNDIFIFASSSETFGITLLEAMGSKLPIACSNRTGLSDILKDAGVYFDPFDISSILSSLKEIIYDQNKREIFGNKAFEYAQKYTWEKCAIETFEFLKTVHQNSSKKINKNL